MIKVAHIRARAISMRKGVKANEAHSELEMWAIQGHDNGHASQDQHTQSVIRIECWSQIILHGIQMVAEKLRPLLRFSLNSGSEGIRAICNHDFYNKDIG
jgi:hypothetical protein